MASPIFGESILVSVFTRQKALFQGEAYGLTSRNEKGVFDILPRHANFITLIKQFLTIYTKEEGKKEYPLDNGVLEVDRNRVWVYIGVGSSK